MSQQLNLFNSNFNSNVLNSNRQQSTHQSTQQRRPKGAIKKNAWTQFNRRVHGGSETKGKRKEFRPLSSKQSIHLVLKSEVARERYSMLTARNQIYIRKLIYAKARKFGVKIASFANVGNHLHLNIRPRNRSAFQAFLRSISGLIPRFVTGARRGKPFGKFWQGLAYTRVLTSRLEELQLSGYIEANRLEAEKSKSARVAWLVTWNRYIAELRNRKKFKDRG